MVPVLIFSIRILNQHTAMILWCLLLSYSLLVHADDIVSGCNRFAKNLYYALPDTGKNVIVSPFGAYMALSLAYEGASDTTADVLEEILNLPGRSTKLEATELLLQFALMRNVTIDISNKIYVDQKFKLSKEYLETTRIYYLTSAENINFTKKESATEQINNWVREHTNNLVYKSISPDDIDLNTTAVLLNNMYFKGTWEESFDQSLTETRKFYISETETVNCTMMHHIGMHFVRNEPELKATVLNLNYGVEGINFIAVLPYEPTGLDSLEKKLMKIDLQELISKGYKREFVLLSLPKFKIDSTADLKGPLRKLGLGKIFDDNHAFLNMVVNCTTPTINKVIQKVFFEVDERGFKSAAVNGPVFRYEMESPAFIASYPFIFFLTANVIDTNSKERDIILFMGKVMSP